MRNKQMLLSSTLAVAFVFILTGPANALLFCSSPQETAATCTLPVPEDPAMRHQFDPIMLDKIDFTARATAADTELCNQHNGRIGKLPDGRIVCVATVTPGDKTTVSPGHKSVGEIELRPKQTKP